MDTPAPSQTQPQGATTTIGSGASRDRTAPAPQDVPSASLVLHCEEGPRVALLREGQPLLVGRAAHADLRVADSGLSREHARFTWNGREVSVEDLGSTNGTKLRGLRVARAVLRPGESISLGRATAVIYALPAGGKRPARASGGPVLLSANMRALYELVERAAQTDAPVLVQGETGSGKELVATAIHAQSERARGPFKAVNCGAIPASLAESLLFGHERGAFTGAHAATPGLFEQAHGGVLFLDEVAELPLPLQAALLRVLEKKVVTRVGDARERAVDVRLVAATHHQLERRVQQGLFREDLLYRLNTVTLWVPPLRERVEEIEPLAETFLEHARQAWRRPVLFIAPDALRALKAQPWPGNVRQLRNVIERAVLSCPSDTLELADLNLPVADVSAQGESPRMLPSPAPRELAPTPERSFKDVVRSYEMKIISEGLAKTRGNRRATARLLRIPLRTLTEKIREFGLGKGGED